MNWSVDMKDRALLRNIKVIDKLNMTLFEKLLLILDLYILEPKSRRKWLDAVINEIGFRSKN